MMAWYSVVWHGYVWCGAVSCGIVKSKEDTIKLEPSVATGCVDGSTPMVWYGMVSVWYGMVSVWYPYGMV